MLSHVKMWEDFVASDADWALDRVRIALALKMRLVNAKNVLDATVDEVKQRWARRNK